MEERGLSSWLRLKGLKLSFIELLNFSFLSFNTTLCLVLYHKGMRWLASPSSSYPYEVYCTISSLQTYLTPHILLPPTLGGSPAGCIRVAAPPIYQI